jgi:hypothetical protein
MPSLDHNTPGDDEKEDNSPTKDYHSSCFNDPYSDNEDSLLEPVKGEDDKKEDTTNST